MPAFESAGDEGFVQANLCMREVFKIAVGDVFADGCNDPMKKWIDHHAAALDRAPQIAVIRNEDTMLGWPHHRNDIMSQR